VSVRSDCLATSDGALVSISISVDPKGLEALLEALAGLDFPLNPGIFHDAAVVTRFSDGHEERTPTTLVEFPAYSERLADVRRAVAACGLGDDSIVVTGMLEELRSDSDTFALPADSSARSRYRVRHANFVA